LHFSFQKHHFNLSHKADSSNTFYKGIIPGEQTRKPPARSTVKVPMDRIPLPDANYATSSPNPSCPLPRQEAHLSSPPGSQASSSTGGGKKKKAREPHSWGAAMFKCYFK
jgi:hypothetical protein